MAPDDLIVGIISRLQHLYLLFDLAAKFSNDVLGFIDDDGETMNAVNF